MHTWSGHPLLLCTLGVRNPACCAHLECAPLPVVHTWSGHPGLLCTLGVRTPACCTLGVHTPTCCAHFEWASRPAVHAWSVYPLLLCTLGVCISLLFQGSPSLLSSRCGRVVSVLKEPPYHPWGPDHTLDEFLSQGALTGDSPQPPALPGQASLTSESCFFPHLTPRLYRGKQAVTYS